MAFFDSLKKGITIVGQAVGEQIQSDYAKIQKMIGDADFYQQKFESLRVCLKTVKTPSWGIFFRQDCVDWT